MTITDVTERCNFYLYKHHSVVSRFIIHSRVPISSMASYRARGPRCGLLPYFFQILLFALGLSRGAVVVDMVRIGNVGNAADATGFGSVSYEYDIAKFPISIGQYCDYLNAVASMEDRYKVYDSLMGDNSNVAGIAKTTLEDGKGFSYSVLENQGKSSLRPITYISWFRAARFSNWMANGQPSTGVQDDSSTENGAYSLGGAVDGNAILLNAINPNTGKPPLFYIAREDEWYKAAYFDPTGDDGKGIYYAYATMSNTAPGNDVGSAPNQANYITLPDGFLSTTQSPNFDKSNYLTDVGSFTQSFGPYGTFDQNGNVWEWCDLDTVSGYRIFRGGAWTSYASYLAASYRLGALATEASFNGGFRLASQPGDSIIFPDPSGASPAPEAPPPPSTSPPSGPPTPPSERIYIQTVRIGDPGNEAEPLTLFGSVEYEFEIGTYMVTIGEYCAFLNAVAANDTYALYNERMATDLNIAGIERKGPAGRYTYTVMSNNGSSAMRPISYVSFFDAARFANWMANGQPKGGTQDASTTEAGAYALYGATSGVVPSKSPINPNTGDPPEYFIPLEDEWYKAGFFDPELNDGSGGYWTYATHSNAAPGNIIGSGNNQANYIANSLYSVTQEVQYVATQNYLSDVGAFTKSGSYYGTFDQNGNLGEWNNANGSPSSSMGTRGNFWASALNGLRSFAYVSASQESNDLGFRIARPKPTNSVLEPPSSTCSGLRKIDPGCSCDKPFWHPKKKACVPRI